MSRPKILIVEDDGLVQRAWEAVFAGRGWNVATASTTAEGLALLDTSPDYLLLDLMLPDRGGEVILRRLRERNLPVHVAVTVGEVAPERLAELRRMKPEDVFRHSYNLVDLTWEGDLARAG